MNGPEEDSLTADPDARRVAVAAAAAADAKKATDVVILDVGDILGIADLFVIASGANERQVHTIVDHVEEALRALGRKPLRREGRADSRWVLLDYGDVVVHVFLDEVRRFYELERLWADADRVDWSQSSSSSAVSSR